MELIYYKEPKKLYKFLASLSDDKNNPNSYVNKTIGTELSRRIFKKKLELDKKLWKQQYEKVRKVYRTLYEEHESKYQEKQ